ncbi:putative adenosine deaminase [Listeria monocytogenes]|nr:putative adenosine deaminase [Listeria monocytogenes]
MIRKIYEVEGNPLALSEEELHQVTVASKQCTLEEYIHCFRLVAAGLRTKRALQLALLDVAEQAALENVLYIEVRLSPLHLTTTTFSMDDVAEALIEAGEMAEKYYSIKIRFIFCCMRRQLENDNLAVIKLAKKYLGMGVVAIDLAGDEGKYPTSDYRSLFIYASQIGVPYTIHAGETGDVTSVLTAMDFGAKRIGHGIAIAQSIGAVELAVKQDILLEMCPVCNIQTRAAQSWQSYPVETFYKNKIAFCFNTDNRTVSETTLTNEFLQVDKNCYSISESWIQEQMKTALNYSFADEGTKAGLKKRLLLNT